MTLELALRAASAATWVAVMALLILPIWRVLCRRPRSLDPLWAVVALGVANRLVFVGGVDRTFAYVTAILLAAVLFLVIRIYQHADR